MGAQVCIPVPLTIAYLRRLVGETFVQPGLVSPRAGLRRIVRPSAHSGGKSWQNVGTGNF